MRSKKQNTSYFDENFEVTYEDDSSLNYDTAEIDFETRNIKSRQNHFYEDDSDYYEEEAYIEDTREISRRHTERFNTARRKGARPTRLAAPIQKGGNAMLNVVLMIIRNLTLFLMLAILILMGYNFLRGSAPYGDIENAVSTNTYTMTLAAYFSVAAILMFYEIISMLWAMTRVRVRDSYGTFRKDVGRGLFSFVLLYLCSHLAFFINDWIPESTEFLRGLHGALDVFGSMHNVLFGLCLAGVISCLFRKYSLSL